MENSIPLYRTWQPSTVSFSQILLKLIIYSLKKMFASILAWNTSIVFIPDITLKYASTCFNSCHDHSLSLHKKKDLLCCLYSCALHLHSRGCEFFLKPLVSRQQTYQLNLPLKNLYQISGMILTENNNKDTCWLIQGDLYLFSDIIFKVSTINLKHTCDVLTILMRT